MVTMDARKDGSNIGRKNVEANNPMNIVRTGDMWYGKVPNSTGRFERFYHVDWGIRAGVRNLLTNYRNLTVKELVHKYAPESGEGVPDVDKKYNDESTYANLIKKHTGLDPNDKVNLNDKDIMVGLVNGIMNMEDHKGYEKVKDRIPKGVELAYMQPMEIATALSEYKFQDDTTLIDIAEYRAELENEGVGLEDLEALSGVGQFISTPENRKLLNYNGFYVFAVKSPSGRVGFMADADRNDKTIASNDNGLVITSDGNPYTVSARDFKTLVDTGKIKRV